MWADRRRWLLCGLILLLAALTVAVYLPVGHHPFFTLDDSDYVLDNSILRGGISRATLTFALTSFRAHNWHPLTWASHLLDVRLFNLSPGPHHLVNLFWHVLNAAFLFLVLTALTARPGRSFLAAGLFALHPLNVESVAWIAERKNLLSTFFWIAVIGAWWLYARRPNAWRYLTALGLFALGLSAKPMLVTMPFILLILDWWPLGRCSPGGPPHPLSMARAGVEKIPFLLLAVASSLVTIAAQGRAVAITAYAPYALRLANAATATVAYLRKMFVPTDLAVYYPFPASGIAPLVTAGAVVCLLALSAAALLMTRRRPWLAMGWLWFLVALVPVIGLVQVGTQAMADRYAYVPLIGLFVALAWLAGEGAERIPGARWPIGAAALAIIALLDFGTARQLALWRNPEALLRRTLEVTGPDNWVVQMNLATVLDGAGRYAEAEEHYSQATRLNPYDADLLASLAAAMARRGRYAEAIANYGSLLAIRPGNAATYYNLGIAQAKSGRTSDAVESYRQTVRLDPNHAGAWNNLGAALDVLGRGQEAIEAYRRTLAIDPRNGLACNNLGLALLKRGERQEGIAYLERALPLLAGPEQAQVRKNLEWARNSGPQ